jgi:hypothetical protein
MPGPASRVIALAALLVSAAAVRSEILPEMGSFEAIYHRDRWGVGKFGFFVVDPSLHEKFAQYEGRRIRVKVTKGTQYINPGPVLMQEVGAIDVLPEPPLVPRVELRPTSPKPNEPFQLICWLENRTDRECFVRTSNVHIRLQCKEAMNWPEQPSYFSLTEGNQREATFAWGSSMEYLVVAVPFGGGTLSTGNRIIVPAQSSFPVCAVFDRGLPATKYELSADATGLATEFGKAWPEHITWRAVDIESNARALKKTVEGTLRVGDKRIETKDDGYGLSLTVAAPAGTPRHLAGPAPIGKPSWAGRLRGFAAGGSTISLRTSEHTYHEDPWRLVTIADDGHQIRFDFRQEGRFTGEAIHRLVLDLLTDRGVESLEIADDFRDVHAALQLPEFGETVHGAKLRVRPASAAFKVEKPLQFHLQAVNVSGSPLVWWMASPPAIGDNIVIEVDGTPIDLVRRKSQFIYGWAAPWTCGSPNEWTLTLPSAPKLTTGKHILRYSILSKGGTYKNSQQNDVPVLDGTLTSNTVEFEIQD